MVSRTNDTNVATDDYFMPLSFYLFHVSGLEAFEQKPWITSFCSAANSSCYLPQTYNPKISRVFC